MTKTKKRARAPRLQKAQRRQQLLDTARLIVREDGADRLTLGNLAERANVSKPVVYDHFSTRSVLLIELYRWLDTERVNTFRDSMANGDHPLGETVGLLASAFIHCATDTRGEVHAVAASLVGSEEKAAVLEELFDHCVQMFVSVLKPHSALPTDELERRCIGLVGGGEALAGAAVRGNGSEADAVTAFASLIHGAMRTAS